MGAKIKAIFVVLILSLVFLHSDYIVSAQVFNCSLSPAAGTTKTYSSDSTVPADYGPGSNVQFTFTPTTPNWQSTASNFEIWACLNGDTFGYCSKRTATLSTDGKTVTAPVPIDTIKPANAGTSADYYLVLRGTIGSTAQDLCKFENAFSISDISSTVITPDCSSLAYSPNPILASTTSVTTTYNASGIKDSKSYQIRLAQTGATYQFSSNFTSSSGTVSKSFAIDPLKTTTISIIQAGGIQGYCSINLAYDPNSGTTVPTNPGNGNSGTGTTAAPFVLCDQATGNDKTLCQNCFNNGEYWTAFGCVGTTKEGIVTSFIRIGMGISGGFVLLSILYGAFLLTTSSGDPTRVKEGQEMITSAIMGLLFVIFSIIILRFIGVTILQIPGFGT